METSNKAPASPSSTSSNLIVFARLSGLLVAVLVLVWGPSFLTPHQLTMLTSTLNIGKWCPGSRNLKKLVHLTMQGVALASGIFGSWANFHLEKGVLSNFHSLHSWMGLICISLFAAQKKEGYLNNPPFLFFHLFVLSIENVGSCSSP
ncbi:hypothetical protein MKW92_008725 [Papaver armeniacum]|nr:hypothetical protein MKW92_008725 [Papaver armeniacum]